MTYTFSGTLIDSASAYSWLTKSASAINAPSFFCSAFVRSSIINELARFVPYDSEIKLLVRWRLDDLISGASDLETYLLCKKLGWKFFICTNFHGKIFYLPPSGVLVGSANATEAGFARRDNANVEVCTITPLTEDNKSFVYNLFVNAYEMNDRTFNEMKDIYAQTKTHHKLKDWPEHIVRELNLDYDFKQKLLVSECLKSDGQELVSGNEFVSDYAKADLSLLGLDKKTTDRAKIANSLKQTKIWTWLNYYIKKSGGEAYFGELASALQDHLVDDPTPHRRDIKILVSNLYGWAALLGEDLTRLAVDRPNYSQRIRLNSL